ncbi:MAG: lytic transglycosylase domain-containing protein [Candidatus Xenobia bacterium]
MRLVLLVAVLLLPCGAWAEDYKQPCYVSSAYVEAYKHVVHYYNPTLPDQTVDEVVRSILWYSSYYKLDDPRLVVAIIAVESRFNPRAVSRHGAQGLGQLMPFNSAHLKLDAFEPYQNIQGCVSILKQNLDRFSGPHKLEYAVAAYNAGYTAVMRAGGPPQNGETPRYVRDVLAIYRQLCGNR